MATMKTLKSEKEANPLVANVETPVAISPSVAKYFSEISRVKNCYTTMYGSPEPYCSVTVTVTRKLDIDHDKVMMECLDSEGAVVTTDNVADYGLFHAEAGDKIRLKLGMALCWRDGGVSLKAKVKNDLSPGEKSAGSPTPKNDSKQPAEAPKTPAGSEANPNVHKCFLCFQSPASASKDIGDWCDSKVSQTEWQSLIGPSCDSKCASSQAFARCLKR